MATATTTSNLDKSAIMRRAWEIYRRTREMYGAWQIERGIIDGSFSTALRRAWNDAKTEARRLANMAGPNGDRIAELKQQIDWLQYKGFGHRISAECHELRVQIASLEAA